MSAETRAPRRRVAADCEPSAIRLVESRDRTRLPWVEQWKAVGEGKADCDVLAERMTEMFPKPFSLRPGLPPPDDVGLPRGPALPAPLPGSRCGGSCSDPKHHGHSLHVTVTKRTVQWAFWGHFEGTQENS